MSILNLEYSVSKQKIILTSKKALNLPKSLNYNQFQNKISKHDKIQFTLVRNWHVIKIMKELGE